MTSSANDNKPLFLASLSPRRKELMAQMGLECEQVNAPVEEVSLPHESPESYVVRIAIEKAMAGFNKVAGRQVWIVAGDTAVVLGDKVFGKPRNPADAMSMLAQLSGKTHRVLSAVAVVHDGEVFSALNETEVAFSSMSEAERRAYVETGEPLDKAGAYAIQGVAAKYIERINGSYSAVMGLPIFELEQLLKQSGFRCE